MALRAKIFVVEQQSIYLDLDGFDSGALHVSFKDGKILAGYARILPPNTKYEECSIGRIVIASEYRGQKLGEELLNFCIQEARRLYPHSAIRIEAQQYLEAFYQKAGFVTTSQPYELDGILHIEMVLQPS